MLPVLQQNSMPVYGLNPSSEKVIYAPLTKDLSIRLHKLSKACNPIYCELRRKGPPGRAVKVNVSAIASDYGLCQRTVRRALMELETAGLIGTELDGYRVVRHSSDLPPLDIFVQEGVTAPKGKNCTLRTEKSPVEDKSLPQKWTKTSTKVDVIVHSEASVNRPVTLTGSAIALTVSEAPKEQTPENIYRETKQSESEGVTAPKGQNCTLSSQTGPSAAVVASLGNVDPEKKRAVIKGLIAVGVSELVAHQLGKSYPLDRIEDQLRWLPLRSSAVNKAGLLVKAIKENFSAPPAAIAKAAAAVKNVEKEHQEEAAPPPGAQWAMRQGGGDRYRIEDIGPDFVRTERFVIARHQWPQWSWLLGD